MFKIYFIEYDGARNEIRRGEHPGKEYRTYAWACRAAQRIYDRSHFEVIISERTPWGSYTRECTCDLCGEKYAVKENHYGHTCGQTINTHDRSSYAEFRTVAERFEKEKKMNEPIYLNPCPFCGGEAVAIKHPEGFDTHCVKCSSCGCNTGAYLGGDSLQIKCCLVNGSRASRWLDKRFEIEKEKQNDHIES